MIYFCFSLAIGLAMLRSQSTQQVERDLANGLRYDFDSLSNSDNILKLRYLSTEGPESNNNFHFETGHYTLTLTLIKPSSDPILDQELDLQNPAESGKRHSQVTLNIYHKIAYLAMDVSQYVGVRLDFSLHFSKVSKAVVAMQFVSEISFFDEPSCDLSRVHVAKPPESGAQWLFPMSQFVVSLVAEVSVPLSLPECVFADGVGWRVYFNSCSPGTRHFLEFPSGLGQYDFECPRNGHENGSQCLSIRPNSLNAELLRKSNRLAVRMVQKFANLLIMLAKQPVTAESCPGCKPEPTPGLADRENFPVREQSSGLGGLAPVGTESSSAQSTESTEDDLDSKKSETGSGPQGMRFSFLNNGFMQNKNDVLHFSRVNAFNGVNQNRVTEIDVQYKLFVFKSRPQLFFHKNCLFQSDCTQQWRPVSGVADWQKQRNSG